MCWITEITCIVLLGADGLVYLLDCLSELQVVQIDLPVQLVLEDIEYKGPPPSANKLSLIGRHKLAGSQSANKAQAFALGKDEGVLQLMSEHTSEWIDPLELYHLGMENCTASKMSAPGGSSGSHSMLPSADASPAPKVPGAHSGKWKSTNMRSCPGLIFSSFIHLQIA